VVVRYSLMAIFENQQGLQEWSWCGLRNRLRRCVYCCPLLPRYALAITIDRVVGSASSAAVENSRPTAVVVLGSIESIQTRRCSRTVNLSSLSEGSGLLYALCCPVRGPGRAGRETQN
jgi:hypothetical protein